MDDTAHSKTGGTQARKTPAELAGKQAGSSRPARAPEWAEGLKRLYDSVVDEPLPDDLASLLARLDQADGGDAA